MSWARFEDDFYENAKVVGLSDAGFRLYVTAITFCYRKRRRDGYVSAAELSVIAKLHGLELRGCVDHLIEQHAFHEVEEEDGGGYTIHDFVEYLAPEKPTPAERGRLGGLASVDVRREVHGTAQPRSNSEATPKHPEAPRTPVPVPVPVPVKSPKGDSRDVLVFDAWRTATGHPSAHFTAARGKLLAARRREKFDEEELADAGRGVALDPWPERVNHDSFEVVFRNAANVEKFRDLYRNGPPVLAAKALPENPVDRRIRESFSHLTHNGDRP